MVTDFLELRTSLGELLARLVGLEFLEVVDKHIGEFLRFLVPLLRISVSVARIENAGVDSGELGGDHEVEVGEHLCGSLLDVTVKDIVDDTACVGNRDALACAVPAGVDQISLCAVGLHLLHELLGIFCGVEREERLAEASRESRSRLGDAALSAGELRGEAAQEVILSLFVIDDSHRRKHTECIGRKEDHLLCGGAFRDGLNDVLDVVDGIRHAGVLGHALVGEVADAVFFHGHVLEQSVAGDGVVDVRLVLFERLITLA